MERFRKSTRKDFVEDDLTGINSPSNLRHMKKDLSTVCINKISATQKECMSLTDIFHYGNNLLAG